MFKVAGEFIWEKSPWWLKCLIVIIFAPLCLAGTAIGSYMAFETWVVSKANTVIDPVRTEVHGVSKRQDDLVKVLDSRINSLDEKINILIERR